MLESGVVKNMRWIAAIVVCGLVMFFATLYRRGVQLEALTQQFDSHDIGYALNADGYLAWVPRPYDHSFSRVEGIGGTPSGTFLHSNMSVEQVDLLEF